MVCSGFRLCCFYAICCNGNLQKNEYFCNYVYTNFFPHRDFSVSHPSTASPARAKVPKRKEIFAKSLPHKWRS